MKRNEYTFGDLEIVSRLQRLNPNNILLKINELIDWKPIKALVSSLDSRIKNTTGRDSYDPFVMFKIQFVQDLKGYSDVQMEERLISDTLYMWFCGISLTSHVPDHSTISRWRDRFNQSDVSQQAFQEINRQLMSAGFSYCNGVVVDATLISSYARSRSKDDVYEVDSDTGDISKTEHHIKKSKINAPHQSEIVLPTIVEAKQPIDPDARILKIGNKFTFGYKMHTMTNLDGLILNLETTAANVLEAHKLPDLLSFFDDGSGIDVYGDKGYCWQSCISYLHDRGFGDKIIRKKKKGREMDDVTLSHNKFISSYRFVIERTFGGLKKWLNLGRAKYIGLIKTHNHNLRLATIYNLVRIVGVL